MNKKITHFFFVELACQVEAKIVEAEKFEMTWYEAEIAKLIWYEAEKDEADLRPI